MRILKSLIVFIYSIYIIASVSAWEDKNGGGWGSIFGGDNDGWDNGGGNWNHHGGHGGGNPHHQGGGWIHHKPHEHHTSKPIIKDPCYNVYCPRGWQCKAGDDGKANCVQVIESCDNVHCPRNQHCEIIDKKAKCVHNPHDPKDCDPCRSLYCPDNYQCLAQPEGGWFIKHLKRHWQLHPQHCGNNPNRVKAICIKSPIGDCSKVKCPPGYKCKLYENGPSCEKIKRPHCLTCKEMHCEQNGLVCVLTPVSKRKLFLDPECCPIVPTCISPNTIAASTIATSDSAFGTTIASLVTGGPPSIGGGSGSISSESEESSDSNQVTTGTESSEESSEEGLTSDFITGELTTDFITDEVTTDYITDEVTTDFITDEVTTDFLDTGIITDELTTDFITDFITGDITTDFLDTGLITGLSSSSDEGDLDGDVTTDFLDGDVTGFLDGDFTGFISSEEPPTDT